MNKNKNEINIISLSLGYGSTPLLVDTNAGFKGDISPHFHDFYEIELMTEAGGCHIINGERYEIIPGEMHLLRLTDAHEVKTDRGRLLQILIHPSLLSADALRAINGKKGNLVTYLSDGELNTMSTLFHLLDDNLKNESEYSSTVVEKILDVIILTFLRKCGTSIFKSGNDKDERIEKIVLYIQQHFSEHIQISDIAAEFFINKNYLCSYFKKHMSRTITEYIRELRLEYATKLLRSTKMDISAVCYACGYGSMSNFLREFKKMHGVTPKEMQRLDKRI